MFQKESLMAAELIWVAQPNTMSTNVFLLFITDEMPEIKMKGRSRQWTIALDFFFSSIPSFFLLLLSWYILHYSPVVVFSLTSCLKPVLCIVLLKLLQNQLWQWSTSWIHELAWKIFEKVRSAIQGVSTSFRHKVKQWDSFSKFLTLRLLFSLPYPP